MDQSNYNVIFEDFTERHYIKDFAKKYGGAWNKTKSDIVSVCERIDMMLQYKRADSIKEIGVFKLVKLDFAVENTHVSPKASGNRCILCVNEDDRTVRILLVYGKNHIEFGQETVWWKEKVFSAFDDVKRIFK